jgi:DNA-directed RNA polymerase specialized sigma subunit
MNRKREWPKLRSSKKQLIISLYFMDNRKPKEIIEITGCSEGYLYEVLRKSFEKLGL